MAEKMEGVTGAAPTMDPAKYPVPIETIWIGNLAEWVDIPHQKKLLARIFKVYGPILDIIMKSSLKRKGQAFIVFTSEEYARQAVEEMDEFPLHGKPMKVRLAKSHSDKTVQTKAADMFEEHKRKRLMIKDYKRAEEAAKANANPAAAQKPDHFDPKPNEHLPPNKTLFLTGLPEDVNEDILNDIFENFNGFKDVRYAKFLNVGWVEFENEQFAIAAKEAASTMTVGAAKKPLVISYKREDDEEKQERLAREAKEAEQNWYAQWGQYQYQYPSYPQTYGPANYYNAPSVQPYSQGNGYMAQPPHDNSNTTRGVVPQQRGYNSKG